MCKYNSLKKIPWPFIAHIKLDEKYDLTNVVVDINDFYEYNIDERTKN